MRPVLFLACALALSPSPRLLAQDSGTNGSDGFVLRTDESDEPIVVTGKRDLDEDRVRSAVRSIAARGRSAAQPLARYHDPLCVTVIGFGETLGERIAERVRMRARLVGVEVAEPGCAPNATLVMVDKPAVLIDRMRRERPGLMDSDSLRRIRATLRRGYPAISWATTERRDRLGRHLPPGNPLSGYEQDSLFNEMMSSRDNRFPSQFNIDFSIARSGAVVVLDAYRMDGVHLDQLADYAAMRILGDPRPGRQPGEDESETILNLFHLGPEEAPPGLTLVDLAYLKGLYEMSPTEPGNRLEVFTIAAYAELTRGAGEPPK
ncbi:hypothetical protein [Erythrobacter sp.]|uniref:hypothetical protein n=1 Tax=Erythrobacter sp. TaxID=1042 RepID=UPI001425DDC5|nr:hypothetical protein [Erythrobacter sp.]QIQ85616.1 MAG: hypothetical protein G9473_02140 [Erythrobacter sp.]